MIPMGGGGGMSSSSMAAATSGPADSSTGNFKSTGGQTIFKLDAGVVGAVVAGFVLLFFMAGRGKRGRRK